MDQYPALPTHTHGAHPTATVHPDYPRFEHITSFGHKTLWVVFALMFLSSVGFTVMAWRVPVQKRLFYQLTTFITVFATLSYYAMASGSGWSVHHTRDHHHNKHNIPDTHVSVGRQVFYARYVDWAVTTPLLLLDLSLLAGLSGSNIVNVIIADVIMVLTGLFAAYDQNSKQKWGWYIMGWAAFLVIIWHLATSARATAAKKGVQKLFVPLAIYTLVLWTLYPIVWGISDGSRKMTVNQEVLAYAILDVLAKPVFGIWLLVAHSRMPASNIELGGAWAEGLGAREGTIRVGDDDDA